jgi:hypothetical protein
MKIDAFHGRLSTPQSLVLRSLERSDRVVGIWLIRQKFVQKNEKLHKNYPLLSNKLTKFFLNF